MTFTELLKSKNIDDDTIKAIQEEMKANKIFTSSEENIDIRYGKLKTDHEGVSKQLQEANSLIEQLKKSTKGNEDLQTKIGTYEQQVKQLQEELAQTKLDNAIQVALLSEKAADVDYLTFKLKAKGEVLSLDESGKIVGWEDKLSSLKTQFPTMFEGSANKKIIENKLPDQQDNDRKPEIKTLADALKAADEAQED